ncbi:uncharacterized protein DNG_03914 [Cephalotrichum gorgonifer]|uniref:Mediator complex subunit 15 KIX domain-containing protein n=1 Tax=Cephalotrichum gorgonifer TaxID=2041049 RepID=A0AAE8MXW0_9PEZI|nr:uncharacterized protein DNG_03914 [Cephalotrichum gorgonifer]
MAANMQHMMMPPGQQGQQQHPMRGGLPVGLQQRVSQAIIRQPIPPNTWQASYQPRDRLSKAISLITNIALSLSNVDFGKAGEAGVKFERDVFLSNQTKEMYEQQMDSKIEEFFQKRKDRGPNVQHALNAQAAVQAQAQAQAQQLLMNPNAMMQMGRGMGPGPGPQQGFQHMQHPAQGSPMPQQQQAQMGMHMNQAGMGMHMGMAGPGGQPMGPNGQMMGMMAGRQGQGQGRPQPANPNGPSGLSAQDRIQVFERAQKQFNSMSDAQKNQLRTNTINRLAPEHLQAIQSQGKDPALFLLQQQMAHEALKAKAAAASPMNMNPNSAQAAQAAMLRQRQISQQGGMNASPHPMPANYGQFENLINQQKAGMMAQEAGQVVVPASNPQGGRNPNQPQGMGHMPNLTMQHTQANLGQAPQSQPDQRQMGMDQQQMLHQGQGKQGGGPQQGGMASQSPGQPAPNRPPGEQGMEAGQGMAQGGAPFNSGLDPRFNQVQRPSPAGMPNNALANSPLFAGLTQDQQRLFMNLPTNKQIEFLQRANQQKNMAPRPGGQPGLMNQGNGQGGNISMMAPGGGMMNNVGPGQVPNLPPVNQAMADNMDVPPQIVAALKMNPEPKTWRDLKQMCAQNPAMQPHMQKLFNWQRQQYFALLQRPAQQGQAQPGMGGQGMPNQAGGQMMNRPQGMPMNMGNLQHNLQQIHVSDQDIALLRASEPKVSQMSDDEVRAYIANMKMVQFARRQQLQQQLHQQQLAQQQQAAVSSTTMQAHPSAGATPMQQQQTQQQLAQQQLHPPPQSQPPLPGASPAGQGPGAQGANQPPKKTAKKAGNQKQPATKSPAPAQKGVKRPFSEDTAEMQAQKNAPNNQRAGVQQVQGQPSGVLPPGADQRAQAQKQQQMAAAGRDQSEDTKRLKAIAEAENRRVAQEPIIEVSLTPEQRVEHLSKIVTLAREVGRTGKAVTKWYGLQRDDERAAIYFHTRCKLARQFEDGETLKKPKQILTMTADEVRQGFEVIKTIWLDCQRAVAAASKTQQGAPGQTRTPLSAANLEAQTAALNNNNQNQNKAQQPQRPGSKPGQPGAQAQAQQAQVPAAAGAGAAAAPASFQLSATSPHGQPKYMNPAKDMNLHIPPKKRAKVNNAKQQGGPQSATPAASEAEKQDSKPPAKPVFYCTEKDCEMATTGFPTEEERQAHVQTEHVQPKENPLNFFKENFAATLGLDNEGNVVDMSTPTGAAMMSATQSKQGQTPVSFAPTPMSRGPSMNRSASGTGARPQGGKAGGAKAATPAGKAGAAATGPTSKTPAAADAYAGTSTTIDPQALFSGIPGFDPVTGGLFSDPTVFQALTPNDTPESSKDSGSSEPMTDLPEFGGVGDADPQWHALGDGFTMMAASSADPGLLLGAGDTEVDAWDGGLLAGEAGGDMLDIDWNEVNVDFSKPLGLDTSLYSMDPTSDALGLGA